MQSKTNTNTISLLTDNNLSVEYGSGQLGLFEEHGGDITGKMLHQLFPAADPQLLEAVKEYCTLHPECSHELQLQVGLNGHARQFKWVVCSRKVLGEGNAGFSWVGNEILPGSSDHNKAFDEALRNLVADAVTTMDTTFSITSMNAQAEMLFGVHAEKVIGTNFDQQLATSPAGIFAEAYTTACNTGLWQGEYIVTAPGKSPVYLKGKISKVLDAAGHLIGYISLDRDITEEKKAAEVAAHNEASSHVLSAIVDQSGAITWATDLQGKKHFLNKNLKSLIGLPEEKTEVHLNEVFDPATARQYQEENEWVIREGKVLIKTEANPSVGTGPVWFRTIKFPLTTHFGVFAAGFAYDVTHEYQQEQELAYLKQRFEIAASISADIIADWDIEKDILWRNEPTSEIPVHNKPAASMQERFTRLHPADKQRFIYSLNQALLSNAGKWECEYWYELGTEPGQFKVLNEKAVILRDAAGEAVRMISIVRDVTEKRRLQAEIREKEKQVIAATIEGQENERNDLGRELHDNVGQVLAMCKLFVDITSDAVQHEYLDKCREHLDKAIKEIRSLSHRLSPIVLERKGLPGAIAELVENINQTGKLAVRLTIANNLCDTTLNKTVKVAAYRIVQEAVSNILRHSDATQAFIRLELAGDKLECRVTDNGKGFDPKVSKPGMGLRNIHNRAGYVGGSLHVHSVPGKGCTLEVSLPLKDIQTNNL
ncbi:sensor histidine kinase [Cnuella takakiae]|nr:PAS domain-containing protein [Cnuella takakiae]OLY92558.1 hypothetical protein BUE76_12160 [Cnuella takakiae]